MASVITTKDGKNHTLFDERDLFALIDEYVGDEARRWLEDFITDVKYEHSEDAEELEGAKEHHKDVMRQLREQSEIIAELIRAREIDRGKLSTAAGKIGKITWRELNV